MDIDDQEDHRSTHTVDMPPEPAVAHLRHNGIVDRVKGLAGIGDIVHQQENTADNEHTECGREDHPHRPQEVDVFGDPVLGVEYFIERVDAKPLIHPFVAEWECFVKMCHALSLCH